MEPQNIVHHAAVIEGSPWFWKLFGGGIMGLIGVLLALIINNLNVNVTSARSDLMNITVQQKTDNEIQFGRLKDELVNVGKQIASLEEFKMATKDKLLVLEKDVKDASKLLETTLNTFRNHDKEVDGNIISMREKLLSIEEKISKMEPAKSEEKK